MFLVLAWLDEAFKDIATLDQLFHLKILRGRDGIKLDFKPSVLSKPIMRRALKRGSSEISPDLAWSTGSALAQLQRICFIGGWPQRITPYNIRRGTLNKPSSDPKVLDAQQNQIAGHKNNTIFPRNYRAKHSSVLISQVFKGHAMRFDEDDIRSMQFLRDRDAPTELPTEIWDECVRNDQILKEMEQERESVQSALSSGQPIVT